MIVLTESNFLEKSKNIDLLLVEFKSELCAPCIRQTVVLEELEKSIKDNRITFAEVDIDDDPVLEEKFKIEATPTLVLITDGKIVGRHEGHLNKRKLKKFVKESITEYRSLQD